VGGLDTFSAKFVTDIYYNVMYSRLWAVVGLAARLG